jgi:hypothetical protein
MSRTRIFDDDEPRRVSIWEPAAAAPAVAPPPLPPVPAHLDDAMREVLLRPVDRELGHRDDFDAREHALAALFARLSPAESCALEQRLALRAPADALAAAFARLVPERRVRLLDQLTRARRR